MTVKSWLELFNEMRTIALVTDHRCVCGKQEWATKRGVVRCVSCFRPLDTANVRMETKE